MNRQDIISNCPEDMELMEDYLKEVIDHFENTFQEIRDLLYIVYLSELDQIVQAANLACKTCDDLY